MIKLIEGNSIKHTIKLDNKSQQINYDIIQSALKIDGLSTEKVPSSTQANSEFINYMRKVNSGSPKLKRIIDKSKNEDASKKMPLGPTVEEDHDVKQYTKLYHPNKVLADEKKSLKARLKKLSYLCQKLPFERSTEEIDNIYRIIKTFTVLSSQVDDDMLKLLSGIILYEHIEQSGVTLFGNKGFYIILSGSVTTLSLPSIRSISTPMDIFLQTKRCDKKFTTLKPGYCFGTMDEIIVEDMDCSKLLLAETAESCSLLVITTSYYRRILEKYNSQKHVDKLTLLKRQDAFTVWPHQALVKIANIFSWTYIPANTLICKEGEISPILAFIQEGSCYVLRKLDVKETLANGKTIVKTTQVVVGTLEKSRSLGEVSLLDKAPMLHSLLSKEKMRVMQADESKFQNLDKDVKLLLRQSCTADFYNITKADVESIYMKQKSDKDWTNFKENVISDVIDSRGIRPGQGKWSVLSSPKDIY